MSQIKCPLTVRIQFKPVASSKKSVANPKAQASAPPRKIDAPDASGNGKEPVRGEKSSRWNSLTVYCSLAMVGLVGIQTCYNHLSLREGSEQFEATIEEVRIQSETLSRIFKEQQRARLSFRVHVEEVNDQESAMFRIVSPFVIGGMTEARKVVFKNYISVGQPRQQEYLLSVDLDWDARDGHPLSDVSPTETDRRFVAAPLTRAQLATIVSGQNSIYFVGRLEYCDIYGECRYFMRCAELGSHPSLVTYCGTQIGDLPDDAGDGQP